MWVILQSNADWDCFKTLTLREILKIQNPLLEEHCAFLEVILLFQQVGCARNKMLFLTVQQNLKSSLWTLIGLRLDGLLALELWDLIVSVLGNVSSVSDRSGQPDNDVHKRHKSQKNTDVMEDIDSVPSSVQSARQEALLYVFEDNEAVIKMIIKGRSPTMRHVSRTHRVALDWLSDRINLDSKIQIKYIDTKNQLADILTKGNFTRDEWNHLLSLFNISHFSSTVCSAAMAKRVQQESGEERVTANSKPMMNLTARMPSIVSSSTSSNPRKTWYGYQDPGKSVVEDDRSGKPDRLYPTGYSNMDYGRSWSSQEWKSEAAAHDRSGKPDETSWNAMQQVRPHHEEFLLDGNAQSVRYGEIIHDGSGQTDMIVLIIKKRQNRKISSWEVTQQNL